MDPKLEHLLRQMSAQFARYIEYINAILSELDTQAYDRAVDHIVAREGFRLRVYLDTVGVPTVGYGHAVRPEDHLKVGDSITKERAYALLQQDAQHAFDAANRQLNELGLNSADFLIALTAVNFQLGTAWTKKFPKTWALMKAKKWEEAAKEVANSLWASQTPVRTADFQAALRALEK